ncbi:hypothetical protein ACN38_g12480, partial [Penicillium nordicum]
SSDSVQIQFRFSSDSLQIHFRFSLDSVQIHFIESDMRRLAKVILLL